MMNSSSLAELQKCMCCQKTQSTGLFDLRKDIRCDSVLQKGGAQTIVNIEHFDAEHSRRQASEDNTANDNLLPHNPISLRYATKKRRYSSEEKKSLFINTKVKDHGMFVESLMRRYQTHVAKEDFLVGFLQAFTAAFTKSNIRSGFEAAGLVPLDADRVISTLDVTEVVKTPTPDFDLPPPTWTSKTPTTALEAQSQSTLIKRSVQKHQNSSPTHILASIDLITKATYAMMHENALLRRENEELRETNHVLSKRRRTKNKQLQAGGSLTITEAQALRATRGDNEVESGNEGESSRPAKRARTGQRHCGICGETGHNARTCQADVETSNEEYLD